jgi:hypothetical protein
MFASVKFVICILLGHVFVNANASFLDTIKDIAVKMKEVVVSVQQWWFGKSDQFVAEISFNKHTPYNIVLIGQTGSMVKRHCSIYC